MDASDLMRIYRQLNRVQKGNWTRLARSFSMAHANKVWEQRLEEKRNKIS
jgi:hypothetical protein